MESTDTLDDSADFQRAPVAPPKAPPQGFDEDGNRIIPPQQAAEFTTNEAEELISLFESADEDKSGTIDEREFRNLLTRLDIHISDEEADKLVIEVDTNNNGLIEWDEFVMMIVKAKRGDVRFNKLHAATEMLKTTPVAMFEAEAEKFGLTVEFRLLEERKATSYNPKTFVMGVSISMTSAAGVKETQTFEAIGFSSREAKFKVAEIALVKMKKLRPGFEFPTGVIPPQWDDWAFNNLNKGVAAVLKMLVEKGFTPAVNSAFMKRFSIHISFLQVKKEHPGELVFSNSCALTTPWCRWIDEQLARGMDGPLILQALQHGGYDPTKDPHFVQRLQKPMTSELQYDFWQCLHMGKLHDIKLFVSGGQNVNEERLDRHAKTVYTPIQLASKHGFLSIVEYLIQNGASVHAKNGFRRTALMFAAKHSHPAVVKLLLHNGASIVDQDNLENNPLHMAAMAGCSRSCAEILTFQEEYLRACIVNTNRDLNFLDESKTFRGEIRSLFDEMMQTKLPKNVRPTFSKTWLREAVDIIYQQVFHNSRAAQYVLRPSDAVLTRVMHRFRLLQEDISDTGDDVEMQQLTEDSKQCILNARHLEIYVELCFLEAYKNAPNRQGRTALHLACDENLVCSHESALRVLLDVFGCDIHIQDNMGKLPIDLLHHRKHRPGSPVENRKRELSIRRARHTRWQNHFSKKKLEKDTALRSDFEDNLLQFLPRRNETGDIDFEHIKECATVVSTTAGWREYKDPQSHNIVYEHISSGRMQLNVPREVQLAHEQRKLWYFRKKSARLLEKQGAWTMHKHAQKQKIFFFNSETGQYQWTKPSHVDGWLNIPSSIKRTMDAGTDVGDDDDESDHDEDERREAINEVSQKLLRTFDEWEEHQDAVTGGHVYFNTQTQQLTREKPQAVLKEELKRQAYILMIKSANFMDQIGDWDKYFDPNTEHYFIYNRITGEGRHETEYDEAILRMDAAQRSNQKSASQLPRRLSPEELSKQNDHAHWLQVLHRARRKETLKTFLKKKEIDEETRRLNQLNEALLTKIHLDFATSTMGYRDARIATEQRSLFKARALGLFISEKINSPTTTASNEAMEFAEWLRNVEVENVEVEDKESNSNLSSRRRVARLVENATWRMDADYCLCFWGCRLWCSIGLQKNDHEHDECRRRIMICRLGCPIFHEAFEWQQPHAEKIELDWHEVYECKSRLVQCPRECGAWIQNDQLTHHMDYMCIKRPVPDLYCRVGCGKVFHGATNLILALEQERTWHELEECPNRIVSCMWPGCQEEMMAKDRKLHRKNHLCASGIVTFKTNGSFEYVVPKDCKYIKVQAWGAGGGSGVLHGYKFGHGGGGAFAEAICPVHPGETLYIVVGEGGQGGIYGEINPSETSDGLPLVSQVGQAFGGLPGGGSGHSSNNGWACGGGGGYTSLCRKGPFGIVTILIVAGGGGGGCRDGLGGGDDQDIDASIKRDVRNGGMGTPTSGGVAGEVSIPNPNFKGTSGQMYQGGHGAEFGGGGGGGYYGGGGGGFSPGIVGGGGGGSSYVDRTLLENVHVETALKRIPGGRERHPPAQKDGGISGEGGLGSLRDVCPGNNGCLRLALPGFFSNMDFDIEEDAMRDELNKSNT